MKELEMYNRRVDLDSKTYVQACNKMKEIINSICNFLTDKKIKFEFSYPSESELHFDVYAPCIVFEQGGTMDFQWYGSGNKIRVRTLSEEEIDKRSGEGSIWIKEYVQELDESIDEEKLQNSILKILTPKNTLMITNGQTI